MNQQSRRVTGLGVPAAVVLAALCGTAIGPVLAQQATGSGQAARNVQSNAELLDDYIHYFRIARYDMAEARAAELLGRKPSAADMVALVEERGVQDFESAAMQSQRVQQLEVVASAMLKLYETGRLNRARDAEQIAQNIRNLTGTARARLLARQRLISAGEYAMPQLLKVFLEESNDLRLRAEVRDVIQGMGRQAVMPLAAALSKVPLADQERIADVLGAIAYRNSLPFLADLAANSQSEQVRAACQRAMQNLGQSAGGEAGGDAASLYLQLAEAYYAERSELTSFPGEDHQLLWEYDPRIGLVMTAIRTPVFHEAVAMRLAERAMSLQAAGGSVAGEGLALWVAANYSREIDSPSGYVNPAYPVEGAAAQGQKPRRGAEYFGVASGAEIAQRVLARAIDTRDTLLARRALAAVERTAGSGAVKPDAQGRMPLAEALGYPNRRVQYDAALALAAGRPNEYFSGAERVVPTLAGAVRGATARHAAVLAADAETYQRIRSVLTGLGYTVLPRGSTLGELSAPVAEAPSIDVVVAAVTTAERGAAVVDEVRGTPQTAATPVLLISDAEGVIELNKRYSGQVMIEARQMAVSDSALANSVKDLVEAASGGPIEASEAEMYSGRSLSALRDLAVASGTVLNVADAVPTLTAALGESSGALGLRIAEILSFIGQERSQRAIADAALNATGGERLAYMALTAESAKRFGNQLEPRQVSRLMEIAKTGGDAEATGAAALLGALRLNNADFLPLIIGDAK